MIGPWTAGLQVRGLDGNPVADFLCGRCGAHKRATGRTEVAKFTSTDPAADHAERCDPATGSHPDRPTHPTIHTERHSA